MKKKDKNPYNIYDDHNISDSVSSTDCTGLIPGNPNSAETFDIYDDIYEFTGSPHNDADGSKTTKSSIVSKTVNRPIADNADLADSTVPNKCV